MLYTELKIKEETYKLRLDARASVLLEKSIGKNPLVLFVAMEKGSFPSLEDVLKIFHATLFKYHNLTMDDVYDLYDSYIEDGGSMVELVPVLSECVMLAGYVPKETDEKN